MNDISLFFIYCVIVAGAIGEVKSLRFATRKKLVIYILLLATIGIFGYKVVKPRYSNTLQIELKKDE